MRFLLGLSPPGAVGSATRSDIIAILPGSLPVLRCVKVIHWRIHREGTIILRRESKFTQMEGEGEERREDQSLVMSLSLWLSVMSTEISSSSRFLIEAPGKGRKMGLQLNKKSWSQTIS
jgi:hypothetical protein